MTQAEPALADRQAIARIYRGDRVIGAGFLVAGGYVLTCAHVVRQALALAEGDQPLGQTLQVDFPYVQLGQRLTAKVLSYEWRRDPHQRDQDLAGLHLIDPIPDAVQAVRFLLSYQLRQSYWVLGFPEGHPTGIGSTGQLLMDLPCGWVQMEDTKTQGLAIAPGFSGAPVWDTTTGRVVGMVVAREGLQLQAKTAFMIPARDLMAARQHLETLDLLALLQDPAPALASAIATAYRLVCPGGWAQPPTLMETLQRLQTVKLGTNVFAALDRFVALLALPEFNLPIPLQTDLRQWGEARVADYPALQSAVQAQFQAQVTAARAAVSYLLIVTDVAVADAEGKYPVSALFIRDGKQFDAKSGTGAEPLEAFAPDTFGTLDTLPQLIQTCVTKALKEKPTTLRVHLVVPVAWLQSAHDRCACVQSAKLPIPMPEGPKRLGVRFSCSVGIAERLHPDVLLYFKELWQEKWDVLHRPGQPVGPCFVAADGLDPEVLPGHLMAETCGGLRLAQVSAQDHYAAIFAAAISTGVPAALWLRPAQFAAGVCVATALEGLLTAMAIALPDAVKRCRAQATALPDNAHIGHHLSFLWEDPRLIPPSAYKSLGMP